MQILFLHYKWGENCPMCTIQEKITNKGQNLDISKGNARKNIFFAFGKPDDLSSNDEKVLVILMRLITIQNMQLKKMMIQKL